MIDAMPRPRPPHLVREITRHGKTVWYVRIGKGRRVRIKGAYGAPEFQAAYAAVVAGKPLAESRRPVAGQAGTLEWLIGRYRLTAAWAALSLATRRQRENVFRHVIASAGSEPFAGVSRNHISAGRDRRKDKPAAARHFLQAMRGLYRWALEENHVKNDPTASVKDLGGRRASGGFPAWTEADVAAYQERFPLGTRERVWLDVLLYTGLRRGDAVKLGRQHVGRDGVARLQTEKTGTWVAIPILPILLSTLDRGPTGDLAFICGAHGKPFTKESFGNEFSAAARKAGIRKSAHGVRKIGATRAAESGASEKELDALFGWDGGRMAALYTKTAARDRLARQAMEKLARGTLGEQALPAPWGAAARTEQK